MRKMPEVCDTVRFDLGVLRYGLKGQRHEAEVIETYPETKSVRLAFRTTDGNGGERTAEKVVPIRVVGR